jgi:hypothetical protein
MSDIIDKYKNDLKKKIADNLVRFPNQPEVKRSLPSFEEDIAITEDLIARKEREKLRKGTRSKPYPPDDN